jgi:hypothetical protein
LRKFPNLELFFGIFAYPTFRRNLRVAIRQVPQGSEVPQKIYCLPRPIANSSLQPPKSGAIHNFWLKPEGFKIYGRPERPHRPQAPCARAPKAGFNFALGRRDLRKHRPAARSQHRCGPQTLPGALAAIPAPEVAAERKAGVERIDRQESILNTRLEALRTQPATPEVCDAITRLSLAIWRWEGRRASLLGLDAPKQVELEATGKFSIGDLRQVSDLIEHQRAQIEAAQTEAVAAAESPVETTGTPVGADNLADAYRARAIALLGYDAGPEGVKASDDGTGNRRYVIDQVRRADSRPDSDRA